MNLHFDDDSSSAFKEISLLFEEKPYRNIFGNKNNRTVAETIEHIRYRKFKAKVIESYPNELNKPLGEFLLNLKEIGDVFYKQFLNKYGDLKYSTFSISDKSFLNKKGIYAYFSGNNLKYIGRCRDTMKKRVNQGYGKITPKNCYVDGQATNCHLNSLICAEKEIITLWLFELESDQEIESLETMFIKYNQPPWNIRQ